MKIFLKQLSAGAVGELEGDGAPFVVGFDDERAGGGDGDVPADGVDRVEEAVSLGDELADLRPEGDGEGFEGKAGIRMVGEETAVDVQANAALAEGAGMEVDGDAQAALVEVGGGGAASADEESAEDDLHLAMVADGNDAEGGDGKRVESGEVLVLADEGLDNAVVQASGELTISQAMAICQEGIAAFFEDEGALALLAVHALGKEAGMAGSTESGSRGRIGEEGGFDKEGACGSAACQDEEVGGEPLILEEGGRGRLEGVASGIELDLEDVLPHV